MSESFGQAALRLSGHAARLLGWRPAEFWAATPAELVAALTPPRVDGMATLSRSDFEQMMEQDHD